MRNITGWVTACWTVMVLRAAPTSESARRLSGFPDGSCRWSVDSVRPLVSPDDRLLMVHLACSDGHHQWGLWRELSEDRYTVVSGMFCGGSAADALAAAGIPEERHGQFFLEDELTDVPVIDLDGLPGCRWIPPVGRVQVMTGGR
ncbi:hypothetical protein OG588_18200 [Streptomyces prunicolor]|uniref:hypothetical protein n=1 Tax=Streptomyces prunicolor TaxID=67348 RepID=UPI00386D3CDB|nr:hypothetical protein OG588_18200 [Streptomyces prunicolor]